MQWLLPILIAAVAAESIGQTGTAVLATFRSSVRFKIWLAYFVMFHVTCQ
jgi:hypothetical protein